MTLQQLRSFMVIVEHGSLRGAARAMDVSQAGLTSSLKALEESLQLTLLHRSGRGVSLTEHGKRLLVRAQLIDREAQRVVEDARQAQGIPGGTLHVGFGPTPTALLLHLVVPDFHARFPSVKLKLMAGFYEQLRPALQQGLIELAITALPKAGAGDHLVSRFLFRSDLAVVGRRGHPRLNTTKLAGLANCQWILQGTPGGPGGTITRFHDEEGLPTPRMAATCDSFTQLSALVTGTDWLAMVPAALVERGLLGVDIRAIKLQESPPSFDNCVVFRREPELSPAAQAFAAMCESCARIVGSAR